MNKDTITRYAELAQVVYEDQQVIDKTANSPLLGFHSRAGNYTDTQMGVFRELTDDGTSTNGLLFVFRGTKEAKDVVTDFLACKRDFKHVADKYDGLRVHKGFLKAWNIIRKDVYDWIDKKRPKRVTFIGHSLGGAIATLASVDVRSNTKITDINCATFGSPLVGNTAFKDVFNQIVNKKVRVVNAADPMTVVPPLRYHHVDELIRVGKAPKAALLHSVAAVSTGKVLVASIVEYHHMSKYLISIKNTLPE